MESIPEYGGGAPLAEYGGGAPKFDPSIVPQFMQNLPLSGAWTPHWVQKTIAEVSILKFVCLLVSGQLCKLLVWFSSNVENRLR